MLAEAHPVNLMFVNALDYKIYSLYNSSLRYYAKLTAHTMKLDKRTEMIMKSYNFQASDLVTILSFLSQFKGACDSDECCKA